MLAAMKKAVLVDSGYAGSRQQDNTSKQQGPKFTKTDFSGSGFREFLRTCGVSSSRRESGVAFVFALDPKVSA
jgi:hypothetical protein